MRKIAILIILTLFTTEAVANEAVSTFDRIIKSGKIRCGYFLFPPLAMIDPETGELSGITVDIFNQIGKNLSLEVEWTEETTFAGLFPGLKTNRYDVICTPTWPTAGRAREAEFVTPQFYAALGVWVRADDDRFTKNFEALNDPSVTVSGVDGQIEQTVRDEQFPKAKMLSLPGGSEFGQQMMNIVTGKADVTFIDKAAGALFAQQHPGKIKNIAEEPLRVFPFSVAVDGGEIRLKNMLDIATEELHNMGFIERKLKEWDPDKHFLSVAKPYK